MWSLQGKNETLHRRGAPQHPTGMCPKWSCVYAASVTQVCSTAQPTEDRTRRWVPALVLRWSPLIGAESNYPKARVAMPCCRVLMQITSRSPSTDRRGRIRANAGKAVLIPIVNGGKMGTRDRLSGVIYFWGRMNRLEAANVRSRFGDGFGFGGKQLHLRSWPPCESGCCHAPICTG